MLLLEQSDRFSAALPNLAAKAFWSKVPMCQNFASHKACFLGSSVTLSQRVAIRRDKSSSRGEGSRLLIPSIIKVMLPDLIRPLMASLMHDW